jgi:hypothetical protein
MREYIALPSGFRALAGKLFSNATGCHHPAGAAFDVMALGGTGQSLVPWLPRKNFQHAHASPWQVSR